MQTVLLLLVLVLVPATGARGQLLRIIDDPRNEAGAEFGYALADVNGGFAVGAPGARVFGDDGAGRIELFATNGVRRRTLEGSTRVPGARLGTALVSNAGRLYASAPGDQPIGVSGLGAVHVFDVASGALIRIISSPDPNANTVPIGGTLSGAPLPTSTGPRPVAQGFGRALAVGGGRIVVGAPDSVVRGLAGAGAVYVFDPDGVLVRTLQDPTPRENAFFGTSVALIGDAIVVGVPGAPELGVEGAGVVQVFDASTGALLRTLSAPISRVAAGFGAVVGGVDGMLFVSAPADRVTGSTAAGAVYVFGAGAARPDQILTPPTSQPGMEFGRAVLAVAGDLLVGAPGAGNDGSGQAFLVEAETAALIARLTPTIARAGGRFGFALAAPGPVVAIGEPATGDSSAAGRVYLFGPSAPASPTAPEPAEPAAPVAPTAAGAPCPLGATVASIDCRLAVLLGDVRDEGLSRIAAAVRRAARDLRRAEAARGPRRERALERAARGVGEVAHRLQSARGTAAHADGTRAALVADTDAIRRDLRSLAESTAR